MEIVSPGRAFPITKIVFTIRDLWVFDNSLPLNFEIPNLILI